MSVRKKVILDTKLGTEATEGFRLAMKNRIYVVIAKTKVLVTLAQVDRQLGFEWDYNQVLPGRLNNYTFAKT